MERLHLIIKINMSEKESSNNNETPSNSEVNQEENTQEEPVNNQDDNLQENTQEESEKDDKKVSYSNIIGTKKPTKSVEKKSTCRYHSQRLNILVSIIQSFPLP